jgi:pyruvate-formate lyase-activating enzyme
MNYILKTAPHEQMTRNRPGEYWLDEYTKLRKTKSHVEAVNTIVKGYKGSRKEVAKQLEYTGALWKHRKVDTSGRK